MGAEGAAVEEEAAAGAEGAEEEEEGAWTPSLLTSSRVAPGPRSLVTLVWPGAWWGEGGVVLAEWLAGWLAEWFAEWFTEWFMDFFSHYPLSHLEHIQPVLNSFTKNIL